MNKKVTYLLGAGASFNALPILSEMKDTMKSLVVKLQQNDYHSKYAENVVDDIIWILKEADDYFTVDTLAKKFFTQQRLKDLEKLKRGLSAYFVIEQFREKESKFPDKNSVHKSTNIDRRYINFLASLTLETERIYKDDGTVALPKDLNIITWNYDMQMELAFARYLKTEQKDTNFEKIVSKNLTSFPLIEAFETEEEKLPNLVHLNGVAGLYNYKDSKYKLRLIDFIDEEHSNEAKTMNQILEQQIRLLYLKDENNESQSNFDKSLTFSWEKLKYSKIAIGRARTIMESTEILVIIGYSFPFFNRVADRYILEPFLDHKNKIRKIYFQDPYHEAYHNFCGKFNIKEDDEFNKLTVTPITNVDEFHLPFEM